MGVDGGGEGGPDSRLEGEWRGGISRGRWRRRGFFKMRSNGGKSGHFLKEATCYREKLMRVVNQTLLGNCRGDEGRVVMLADKSKIA